MFKQRLITSLILVPLVLTLLFFANPWFLVAILFLILLACGWEWTKLCPFQDNLYRLIFFILLVGAFWISAEIYKAWLFVGLGLWLLILFAVLTYPDSKKQWGKPSLVALAGIILLPLFVQSLIQIYQLPQGKKLVLYLLFLIWAADVGAYLSGKQWGRHKLIPQVSPGKSWEGFAGGMGLAMLVAIVGYLLLNVSAFIPWMLLSFVLVCISVLGDLFISVLKRRCQLKDTGSILPGHGGVLDRLDSLIAALPFFYFGLTFFSLGF